MKHRLQLGMKNYISLPTSANPKINLNKKLNNTTIKKQSAIFIAFIFCTLLSLPCFASPQDQATIKLFDLINQRLSYMKDVGLYKAQRNMPIKDKQRETLVINKAAEAALNSGVDPRSSVQFLSAHIEAAKAIQSKIISNYSSQQIKEAKPKDLKQKTRPALLTLDQAILRSASDYLLRFGPINADKQSLFFKKINNTFLEQDQKQVLFSALSQLRLAKKLPEGFVDVKDISPNIQLELRYISDHNFVGKTIDGYFSKKLILTKAAAKSLASVQTELESFGLGLLVYDAYRPQRAADHFVRWAEDLTDTKTKQEFYPKVKKSELFKQDYIASRSSHTRGSTVDLTLIRHANKNDSAQPLKRIDMGSPYDFFGPVSWLKDLTITGQQRANRILLQTLMIKHGFKPYPEEWWYFTLIDEPFPDTYFDFPIVDYNTQ
jgi:D-alanyl-D-alanine dipeptidase